jgi:hypothetical protein
MFYRWRRAFAARRFNLQIAGALGTAPLRLTDAPLSIVSMVSTGDLPMYLLALKSFYGHIGRGKVVAIIARTSRERLRRLLREHVPGIEIVEIESIPIGSCQAGGCWERLLYILDRAEHEYVIQLDSDTLTIGHDIPEVKDCIAANRSFVLSGGPAASGLRIVSMREAAASADVSNSHINFVAQRCLDVYPDAEALRYVRGSGAFAGFARGGYTRRGVEEFHHHMAELLGARWREWGTEQCASNFAIANSPEGTVLPWPEYANFRPQQPLAGARFLHFYGSVRYEKGRYAQLARELINGMASRQRSEQD